MDLMCLLMVGRLVWLQLALLALVLFQSKNRPPASTTFDLLDIIMSSMSVWVHVFLTSCLVWFGDRSISLLVGDMLLTGLVWFTKLCLSGLALFVDHNYVLVHTRDGDSRHGSQLIGGLVFPFSSLKFCSWHLWL